MEGNVWKESKLMDAKQELGELNIDKIIESGRNPLDPTPSNLCTVDGIEKLKRSLAKELKNRETSSFDDKCSNLPQLVSILKCILLREKTHNIPYAVLKPFSYRKGIVTTRFIVDIVSKDRDEWIKVSARNPKSLSLLAAGGGGFGQRSILDHARDYLQCSQQNHSFFKPPQVTFIFTSGIGSSLAERLKSLGIRVEGELIRDSDLTARQRVKVFHQNFIHSQSESSEDSEGQIINATIPEIQLKIPVQIDKEALLERRNPSLEGITKLNLDITAFIAFTSNLTNGHANVQFKTQILTQQLQFEKTRPQKTVLENVFRGRELYCCETALLEFQSILKTVGGPEEKQRAAEFLTGVTVIPDQMSLRSKSLALVGNIKLRSLTIFGTGDSIEAVTVTANSGFVRSALSQGIEFPVFLHESRALTECKENLI